MRAWRGLVVSAAIALLAVMIQVPVAWAQSAPAASGSEQPLVLRRVMLSTGGVGYFEYEARVTGTVDLAFSVRRDQIDDVLKSLVVYDDHGGVGTVRLPGPDPLREVFRDLPFGPEALSSPVTLLNALRGAEVRAVGTREITGRLVAVTEETVQLPDSRGTITRHRVTLATAQGFRQFVLEETDSVQFVDERLQGQVDTALAALARLQDRDRRTLTVRSTGEGERTVRVAYVVEAPLWKTAYRLTLSDDIGVHAAALQGWAVVENVSGENWQDVDLTVVSGNPVTFRQALYQAYYVSRPEVPVEVLGRVLPRTDVGTVPAPAEVASRDPVGRGRAAGGGPRSAPGAMAEAQDQVVAGLTAAAPAPEPSPPPPPIQAAQVTAASSTEATTQVLFRFPQPVTVGRGETVLIPILSRDVPVDRVALFQPGTHPLNPLASVRVTNDGDSGLPPGVLTLYERAAASGMVSYLGDARLGALPVGEQRMLSFALDSKVRVTREDRGAQTITQASVVDGVLRLTLTERSTATYTIQGAAREPRAVVLEHPRVAGWNLVDPPESGVEMTPDQYRITRQLAAGESATVAVVMERPRYQQVELASFNSGQIEYYASSTELSAEIRAAIAHLAEFQANIADRERQLRALEAEVNGIVTDQDRIRRNLNSVPRDSDLYQRYLTTLNEQEDRLGRLRGQIEDMRGQLAAARQALLDYARGLNI